MELPGPLNETISPAQTIPASSVNAPTAAIDPFVAAVDARTGTGAGKIFTEQSVT
jgi:hypothetical protein